MTVREVADRVNGLGTSLVEVTGGEPLLQEATVELLEALLVNKERYGYMPCPCRLASGNRELDKDILCPCVYRTPDVGEFGSCYCHLYVSRAWNEDRIRHVHVPERRPLEKLPY